jgi:hypothetical protein
VSQNQNATVVLDWLLEVQCGLGASHEICARQCFLFLPFRLFHGADFSCRVTDPFSHCDAVLTGTCMRSCARAPFPVVTAQACHFVPYPFSYFKHRFQTSLAIVFIFTGFMFSSVVVGYFVLYCDAYWCA